MLQLLTTPHVMTAIAVTSETILALTQLIVIAYWVRRWEKNNAAWDRRFEEIKRANSESIEDRKHRFDETVKAWRESRRLLRETIERLNGAATPPS